MQFDIKGQYRIKPSSLLNLICGAGLLMVSSVSFAAPIAIHGNHTITTPVVYQNAELDMTDGRFTIAPGGSLTIENSTINVTISPSNPYFTSLTSGSLNLKKNIFQVHVVGIAANPNVKSNYNLIPIKRGTINIASNEFSVDSEFTVGFLGTENFNTNGFMINSNTIRNFHGGIYLTNSHKADINFNTFENVSFANVYNMGNLNNIKGNTFSFPGNLKLGDAIDIVNSNAVDVADNVVSSGSNYGIYIAGGSNLIVENNKIMDNASYGIFIATPTLKEISKHKYLASLIGKLDTRTLANSEIWILNNYVSQNRFGLAGGVVDKLDVENNIFIQRFSDNFSRQFWTNNDNLLPLATQVTWLNNSYKEAFTQEVPGNNVEALQFVVFPAHGGVVL